MTPEELEKGNRIYQELKTARLNLEKARHTQKEDTLICDSYLNFDGINGAIEVPPSLFKNIGLLIFSYYEVEIIKLEQELNKI